MRTSGDGIKLIEQFEGLRLHSYQDGGGKWTIGYGHTGKDVYQHQLTSQLQAERWLEQDVAVAEQAVNQLIHGKLTQHQFDALVSFVFNIGVGAFRFSHVLSYLNASNIPHAIRMWKLYVHDDRKKVESGLVKRREAEIALFQKEEYKPDLLQNHRDSLTMIKESATKLAADADQALRKLQ